MRISRAYSQFLCNESGAVSVDWVVLTAGIVGLGLIMIQAVGPSTASLANSAGDRYATTHITVVGAPTTDGTTTDTSTGVTVEVAL